MIAIKNAQSGKHLKSALVGRTIEKCAATEKWKVKMTYSLKQLNQINKIDIKNNINNKCKANM
jgi:hypothetical protein